MTDLNKPLGQRRKKQPDSKLSVGLYYGTLLALVVVVGYGIYKTRIEPGEIAAIKNATVVAEKIKKSARQKPANAKSSRVKPATNTTPLSPLTPLAPRTEQSSQPDFQPQKAVFKRRRAGSPIPELLEKTKHGSLPRISTSGMRPLDAYSQAPTHVSRVRVAIVVGGLGLSQTGTKRAIEKLPPSITLAYSPIGNSLQRWMQMARKQGHEVVLQIPMEPLSYPAVNPGRGTLVSSLDTKQNLKNLRWALGRMSNYPIVMNYLGANFVNKPNQLRPILEEIKQRGLGWFDDGTVRSSVSLDIAEEIKLPNANGSFVLDGKRNAAKIAAQLKGLELFAKRRGFAIATASAFPASVKAIAKWAKNAEKRGIQIVPLSNLIRDYQR